MSDGYIDGIPHADGTEKLHECRIRFWWGADARHVESYGCTKALYKAGTKGGQPGYWVSDEDAAKKSLTDAITKAASWLGVAGDIFMGRWDDSKYVEGLKAEANRPTPKAEPPHDPETGEIDDEDANPPSVDIFIKQLKMQMDPKDAKDRDKIARAYAAAVIENVAARKPTAKARQWFEIFTDLHSTAISRLPEAERFMVRNAIAFKRAQIEGENPNPGEFGHPFGEPTVGERMVAAGSFGG
jgi:hypothetical protein